jgi:hypothetical protein
MVYTPATVTTTICAKTILANMNMTARSRDVSLLVHLATHAALAQDTE